jgi:glucose/arabinose dehydrogenase
MRRNFLWKILIGSIVMLLGLAVMASKPNTRAALSTAWPTIQLKTVASGFQRPIFIGNAGDTSGRLFVVEQAGLIRILHSNGSIEPAPFLDITDRVRSPANGGGSEQGLLSVAFPPEYTQKGYFYVYYTRQDGNNQVARFHLTGDPNRADPASEQQILLLEHPGYQNHNGGQLAFGSDGYLYIGTGDGGGGGDPNQNAQNPASLLGKILRIDVEYTPSITTPYSEFLPCIQNGQGQGQVSAAYRIPPDNPFVHQAGYRGEIWAMGMRNPWRFSFDRQTHGLWIGDVGQDIYEEVDFQPAASSGGENYGWNVMEGNHCYNAPTCNINGMTPPIAEYDHSQGCSITGGYIYRGKDYPALQGIYLYADYCSGTVWGLQNNGGWQSQKLLESGLRVSSFGESEGGELYIEDLASGVIYQVTGTAP